VQPPALYDVRCDARWLSRRSYARLVKPPASPGDTRANRVLRAYGRFSKRALTPAHSAPISC
jgi:hypothetical protein